MTIRHYIEVDGEDVQIEPVVFVHEGGGPHRSCDSCFAAVADGELRHAAGCGAALEQKRVHPPGENEQRGWIGRSTVSAESCIDERLRQIDDAIMAAGPPEHLADIAPSRQCDRCGRKTWTRTAFGTECGMPQPDGERCAGRFKE